MICITDSNKIILKNRIDDENYVRIGITQIFLWVNGTIRNVRDIGATYGKPWCEFTINELSDLLAELHELEFWVEYRKKVKSL